MKINKPFTSLTWLRRRAVWKELISLQRKRIVRNALFSDSFKFKNLFASYLIFDAFFRTLFDIIESLATSTQFSFPGAYLLTGGVGLMLLFFNTLESCVKQLDRMYEYDPKPIDAIVAVEQARLLNNHLDKTIPLKGPEQAPKRSRL